MRVYGHDLPDARLRDAGYRVGAVASRAGRRYCATCAAGRHLTTLAFSERGSLRSFLGGSEPGERRTAAIALSAEKSWVTSAGHADSYIVIHAHRRTGRAAFGQHFALLRIPEVRAGGSSREAARDGGTGPARAMQSAPMRLTNALLPASMRVCPEGEGLAAMMKTVLPFVPTPVRRRGFRGHFPNGDGGNALQHLRTSRLEHLGQALSALTQPAGPIGSDAGDRMDTQDAFMAHVAACPGKPWARYAGGRAREQGGCSRGRCCKSPTWRCRTMWRLATLATAY